MQSYINVAAIVKNLLFLLEIRTKNIALSYIIKRLVTQEMSNKMGFADAYNVTKVISCNEIYLL